MKKAVVIEALDSLEDDFDADKLFERILFIEKVERGIKDGEEGKVMDFEDAKQKFYDRWSK